MRRGVSEPDRKGGKRVGMTRGGENRQTNEYLGCAYISHILNPPMEGTRITFQKVLQPRHATQKFGFFRY